jgi:hypothetical protein
MHVKRLERERERDHMRIWSYAAIGHQKLVERPGSDPPLTPSERVWPCQGLGLRLLVFRIMRK